MLRKKLVLVLGIIVISTSALFSQVNVHGEFVLPTADNAKPLLGIGLSIQQEINAVDGLVIGALASYRQELSTDYFGGQIPFMGFARYYIGNIGFYPQFALGGVYMFYTKTLRHPSNNEVITRIKANTTRFALDFGLGYKLDNGIDFTLYYENIVFKNSSLNNIGLRVAFAI